METQFIPLHIGFLMCNPPFSMCNSCNLKYILYIYSMDSVLIDTKRLWTKSEYSKKFGHSRATIDKWIDEKRLKAVKVNGTTLIIE